MPTVNTPLTYIHLLNLLSAFTSGEAAIPLVDSNFSPVLLLTNWKDVVCRTWSATLRTNSSGLFGSACAKTPAEQPNSSKVINNRWFTFMVEFFVFYLIFRQI